MMDGATVANSELMIFAPDGGESEDGQYVDYVADGMPSKVPESIRYGVFIDENNTDLGTNNFYIQPQIVINIPEGIDTRIIESVAIYSTRIIPVYDFEQTWNGKWSLSDRGSGDDTAAGGLRFRKPFAKDDWTCCRNLCIGLKRLKCAILSRTAIKRHSPIRF